MLFDYSNRGAHNITELLDQPRRPFKGKDDDECVLNLSGNRLTTLDGADWSKWPQVGVLH